MDRLNELIGILSDKKVQDGTFHARQARICKICKRPAVSFKSTFSESEYKVSTICEDCQVYFGISHDRFT